MKTFSYTITNPRDNFNKDRFLIKDDWFVVADGISSKGKLGADAADYAVETVNKTNSSEITTPNKLKNLIQVMSKEIRKFGGGTTFTSIMIKGRNLILGHTGDSECYLLYKNGSLIEITTPFTLAYEQFKKGFLDKEDLKISYYSNVLIDYLGAQITNPQIKSVFLENVVAIILRSDGANNVSDQETKRFILDSITETNPAKAIAEKAAELGSKDDITVLVIVL